MCALPNLEQLVGTDLAHRLCAKAGGLPSLAKLNDNALRHLGYEDIIMTGPSHAKQLHCGYLMEAPVFVESFGDGEIAADVLRGAQKALTLLGRKCALAAKTDLLGGSADGQMGASELERLKTAFARLKAEGKVSAVDTQALPVPEVQKRGEAPERRRGGIKDFKRRERQLEVPGVLQKALSRVKMGISEEEQRAAHMESTDLRLAYLREQEKEMQREALKRPRQEVTDDYDDLLNIML